jgi:hypothetical protein
VKLGILHWGRERRLRVFEKGVLRRKVGLIGDELKADSHIACRAHAVPLPCRGAKGLECVFPI